MLYLDCSCLNLALGIFLKFLEFFRIFFVALSIYLDISGSIFAQENISKKTKLYPSLPGRAQRPDPSRPTQPVRQCGAHLGPVAGRCPWRARPGHPGRQASALAREPPIKGEAEPDAAVP
jgi:hypothetical protein